MRAPIAPEDYIEAVEVLESVQCSDDYDSEFAEGWPNASKEQLAELTAEIRKVLGGWLDKHGLRPTFFICDEPVAYCREAIMKEEPK